MDRRARFFWYLTITIATIVSIVEGFTLNSVHETRLEYEELTESKIIGTDEQLVSVIETLETRLKKRNDYVMTLRNDPMKLTKVVMMLDENGNMISTMWANSIRVSSIISGEKSYALVQYNKEHRRVEVGDKLGGYKIIMINPDGILTIKEGKKKFHPVQSLAMDPSKIENYTN
jgi:hypothetical protein